MKKNFLTTRPRFPIYSRDVADMFDIDIRRVTELARILGCYKDSQGLYLFGFYDVQAIEKLVDRAMERLVNRKEDPESH